MSKKTRTLTFTALLVALTVAFLYIAAVIPTSRIGLTALTGLLVAAAVIEYGIKAGLACFACSAVLGAILIPLKSVALLYIIFFGCYPIFKSLVERTHKRVLEWALKLVIFNLALTIMYLLWYYGFLKGVNMGIQTLIVIYAGGNFCFVLYDIAFSKLVQVYIARFYKKR